MCSLRSAEGQANGHGVGDVLHDRDPGQLGSTDPEKTWGELFQKGGLLTVPKALYLMQQKGDFCSLAG